MNKKNSKNAASHAGNGKPTAKQQVSPAKKKTRVIPERVGFAPPLPPCRRLRGYAIDPSLATGLDTKPVSEVIFSVPWEKNLQPGPTGEYLEVIDVDPASGYFYEPVNLNNHVLLAQDGLPPSEGLPQFHQQMVYAVASLTIKNFEHALGRRTFWRPGPPASGKNSKNDSHFVEKLRIYPHALRERNAYYNSARLALLFGYFTASDSDPGDHMGGSMVFTCLSHDIIAHETTHALLDGMNRELITATNPDVHAFHEAFADIIALFQHFTFPEILRHQIMATRGAIDSQENLLGQLAGQFGHSTGMRQALRNYIGQEIEGKWVKHEPDPTEYEKQKLPHARGAILVAAVFEAFFSIYNKRTADLIRIATGGRGILEPGAIHPDLANRLAGEAAKAAQHVLTMCVRAVDYLPPVDVTFGEFLRALITADHDVVPDDDLHYRVAFLQAFRRRGIYPRDVRTLSIESLLWRGPVNVAHPPSTALHSIFSVFKEHTAENIYASSRRSAFFLEREMRIDIHASLQTHLSNPKNFRDAYYLGIEPSLGFEVRTVRFAFRANPDGVIVPQLIVSLLQQESIAANVSSPALHMVGGCTVIVDLRMEKIVYCISKPLRSVSRQDRQRSFQIETSGNLRATYLGPEVASEAIAALHRGC